MDARQIQPQQQAWYLRRISGSGMTGQSPVVVLAVRGDSANVRHENGRTSWVKAKNLRPTN